MDYPGFFMAGILSSIRCSQCAVSLILGDKPTIMVSQNRPEITSPKLLATVRFVWMNCR